MNRWFHFHRLRFVLIAAILAVFVIGALTTSTLNLGAQGGAWEGRYWNNRDLSGNPVLVRQDASINFDCVVAVLAQHFGQQRHAVSYTHLTLPTNREV